MSNQVKAQKGKYVKTTDDFHPNYPGDLVRVLIGRYSFGGKEYSKFLVLGAADYGFIREGSAADYVLFEGMFAAMPETITKELLEANGFVNI